MPSPFNITAVTPEVQLNSQRQGVASYTVSNVSSGPIRGRAILVPLDQTHADWLKLEGDIERDFSVSGTQQYAVEINVPNTAAAGDYTFRLDMVGVQNPDELFSQGQPVTFKVPEGPSIPPPPPVKDKGYIITVIGAIVGALAGVSAGVIVGIIIVLILTAVIKSSDLGTVLGLIFIPILLFTGLGIWVGTALGGWIAVKVRKLDWPARTGWVLAGVLPLWVIIFALGGALLSGITSKIPGGILSALIDLLILLVPPGLIARAIVLRWKTGKF